MSRQMRREVAGAIYHLMNRGDRREETFRSSRGLRLFLATLAEACGKTGCQIHAYCLMRHHFHLLQQEMGRLGWDNNNIANVKVA